MARSLHPEATAAFCIEKPQEPISFQRPDLSPATSRETSTLRRGQAVTHRSCFLGRTLKPSANQEVTAGHLRPIGHAVRHQTDQLGAGVPQGRCRHVLTEGSRATFFFSPKELQSLGNVRTTCRLKHQKHISNKNTLIP